MVVKKLDINALKQQLKKIEVKYKQKSR